MACYSWLKDVLSDLRSNGLQVHVERNRAGRLIRVIDALRGREATYGFDPGHEVDLFAQLVLTYGTPSQQMRLLPAPPPRPSRSVSLESVQRHPLSGLHMEK